MRLSLKVVQSGPGVMTATSGEIINFWWKKLLDCPQSMRIMHPTQGSLINHNNNNWQIYSGYQVSSLHGLNTWYMYIHVYIYISAAPGMTEMCKQKESW